MNDCPSESGDPIPLQPDGAPAENSGPMRPYGEEAIGQAGKPTVAVADAITAVYQDLQTGAGRDRAHAHFLQWASDNPTQFYNLFTKLLSREAGAEACSRTVVGSLVFRGVND